MSREAAILKEVEAKIKHLNPRTQAKIMRQVQMDVRRDPSITSVKQIKIF